MKTIPAPAKTVAVIAFTVFWFTVFFTSLSGRYCQLSVERGQGSVTACIIALRFGNASGISLMYRTTWTELRLYQLAALAQTGSSDQARLHLEELIADVERSSWRNLSEIIAAIDDPRLDAILFYDTTTPD